MKLNRTYLFIGISSLALLTVLVIQVNWLLQTARMKEELFNEKAGIVLAKTAEALSRDKATFSKLQLAVGKSEAGKIDSLFKQYMKVYNIRINYYFEVKPGLQKGTSQAILPKGFLPGQPASYVACMEDEKGKQVNLKLVFPGKKQFILAEMGAPFLASVLLILVVLVLSWRTIFSLLKEKRISEHTSDFLSNMTHELKTPLTNIALAGRMIARDPATAGEEKIKHYTSILLEENEKLRLQVEQVLSMTALEKGEIPLHKTELDMHALIREALQLISLQIENRQGQVKLDFNARQTGVKADRTHLANALRNLLDNALKYSEGKPELVIQTGNVPGRLLIKLSDKGIGIEKQYQKNVFDKFFRVPTGDVHNVKGFGLGLAYVKKIVELHGGSIALLSEKGKGTTFTISLPHA